MEPQHEQRSIDRRRLLMSAGAAIAGSSFTPTTMADDQKSESVADRTSSIRITQLTPNVFRDRVFVKIGKYRWRGPKFLPDGSVSDY